VVDTALRAGCLSLILHNSLGWHNPPDVGVARYKFVLTVITTDMGLYIENRKVFRPGHHPLLIPFTAIHNARKQTLFFWEFVAFDVDDLASVRLPSKVFEGTPVVIAR
jgi:hypothetical protein